MQRIVALVLACLSLASASWIGGPAYSTSGIVHAQALGLVGHGVAPLPIPHGGHVPLSLAPHAPAVVLGPNGVPLDTPEVVAARNAHLQAKALAGAHLIHKRSLWAPAATSWTGRIDIPTKVIAAPALIKPAAWGPGPWGWPAAAPLGLHANPHGWGVGMW